MHQRGMAGRIEAALDAAPVVIVEGARAVGKSTLSRAVAEAHNFGQFVDLSDAPTLRAAERDPDAFVAQLEFPVVIDEAQLVPELTLAIKRAVDDPRRDARFLLTGSTRVARETLGGGDPLAARAVRLTIRPLSISERWQRDPAPIAQLLTGGRPEPSPWKPSTQDLMRTVLVGGVPTVGQVLQPPSSDPDHATSVLERYAEASLALTNELRVDRFRLLAVARVVMGAPATLLNLTQLGQQLELTRDTMRRYLDILDTHHLVERLGSLRHHERQRATTHPKLLPVDLGVAAQANDWSVEALDRLGLWGSVFESAVLHEIIRQVSFSAPQARCEYWRTQRGDSEVDLVITTPEGVIGFEVKSARDVDAAAARGLRSLRDFAGARWIAGYVVHAGQWIEQLDPTIWSIPFTTIAAPPA